jgi:hypothetical protein
MVKYIGNTYVFPGLCIEEMWKIGAFEKSPFCTQPGWKDWGKSIVG